MPTRIPRSRRRSDTTFLLFNPARSVINLAVPDEFPYDVFLSHSSKDKAVVRPIAARLRQDGVKLWFDEWEIKPGDSIPAKLEEGLERSRVLVLCMSANAFGSDWAQLESGTFRIRDPLNKERRFLPLRLNDGYTRTKALPPICTFATCARYAAVKTADRRVARGKDCPFSRKQASPLWPAVPY